MQAMLVRFSMRWPRLRPPMLVVFWGLYVLGVLAWFGFQDALMGMLCRVPG